MSEKIDLYNPAFVASIIEADKAPPEALARDIDGLLEFLNTEHQMSEMVERVAIAICEKEIGGKLPHSLDETGEASARHWRALSRAAIAAVRVHLVQCAARDREQAYYAAIEEIDEALK